MWRFPTLLFVVVASRLHSGTIRVRAEFDFTKDVAEGPGSFENIVPDGWEVGETGNVIFMNDAHWERYRRDTERFVVFYHAKDCKWCNFSKPGFIEASRKFRRSMPFLAIDCKGKGASTCLSEQLTSYPRLKYYDHEQGQDGPEDPEFFERGPKESGDFVTYVEKKLDEVESRALAKASMKAGEEDLAPPSVTTLKKLRVKQLRKMLKSRNQVCHGCTDKDEFVKLVRETWHLPLIAAVKAGSSSGSVADTARSTLKTESQSSGEQNNSRVKKKRRRKTLMQEKRERELKIVADQGWSAEEYGNGDVLHSYDGHFEDVLLAKQKSSNAENRRGGAKDTAARGVYLVFFYAPWCGHCKAAKPELVGLSVDLQRANSLHRVVAIQGDTSVELANKYKLRIFPTFHVFRHGMLDDAEYNDAGRPRSRAKLFKFLMQLDNPSWEPDNLEPFVNRHHWGMDGAENEKDLFGEPIKDEDIDMEKSNGEVIFMDDEHFEDYRRSQEAKDGFLVFFYAPWCSHCKFAKPHYAFASTRLREDGDDSNPKVAKAQLLAMDCKGFGMDTCRKRGIGSYPTFQWFFGPQGSLNEAGDVVEYEEWEGGRDVQSLIDQVKLWLSEGYTPAVPKKEEQGTNVEGVPEQTNSHGAGDSEMKKEFDAASGADASTEAGEGETKSTTHESSVSTKKTKEVRKDASTGQQLEKTKMRVNKEQNNVESSALSVSEMRDYISKAIQRISSPGSLSRLVESVRNFEAREYPATSDPDDFEFVSEDL